MGHILHTHTHAAKLVVRIYRIEHRMDVKWDCISIKGISKQKRGMGKK